MDVVVAEKKVARPRGPSCMPTLLAIPVKRNRPRGSGFRFSSSGDGGRVGKGPRRVSIGRHNLYAHESEAMWLTEQLAAAEQKPVRGRGRRRGMIGPSERKPTTAFEQLRSC
jgi:hypothetical protein